MHANYRSDPKVDHSRVRTIFCHISIASEICIRSRLDMRTLPREGGEKGEGKTRQPTPRQRVARANFNGEFLIGQFVPSRSDEQFHDGVVSPLIRLKRIYYSFVCTSLVEFRDILEISAI